MISVIFAVAALLSVARACPGSAVLTHAKAEVQTAFAQPCDVVITEMLARMNGEGGWTDPHNGGTYTLISSSSSRIEAQRLTGDGKYTDLMDFTFEAAEGGCAMQGCSESQVQSIMDFSTNFCNLHVLYCGDQDMCPIVSQSLDYKEKVSASFGAGTDSKACVNNAWWQKWSKAMH